MSDESSVTADQYRQLMAALKQLRLPMALTKQDAARELSIGVTQLDKLIAAGHIQAIHYENKAHPKIPSSELARFIAERLTEARAKKSTPPAAPARRAGKKKRTPPMDRAALLRRLKGR